MLFASTSIAGSHLFLDQGIPGAALSEIESGIILFVCSIFALISCLLILVKVLNTVLKGPMAKVLRRVINADFPGYFSCLTGYFAMLVGAGVTILVQSSSVTTAVLTPLVGIGLISVDRIFPLVLGANL
jgi:sodium-dependent phosphate cotransporter